MGSSDYYQSKSVAIIGGGPAGLMAAEVLCGAGLIVDLFCGMPPLWRKFFVAGKGGLNLTNEESREQFLSRYGKHREYLEPLLNQFGPQDLRKWVKTLGIDTFVGTSGRVFPVGMKSFPLLQA